MGARLSLGSGMNGREAFPGGTTPGFRLGILHIASIPQYRLFIGSCISSTWTLLNISRLCYISVYFDCRVNIFGGTHKRTEPIKHYLEWLENL